MNKPISKYLILLLAIFLCPNIISQNTNARFKHIDIEQGLSQNMIKDILQDSKGFMWFATWDGLNRYDGYEFKIFKHVDGDTTSLPMNKITCLLEDNLGRLWIGTAGGGLCLFDSEKERFITFSHNPEDKSSIGGDYLLDLHQDGQNRIWVGLRNEGLSLIENSSGPVFGKGNKIRFKNFTEDPKMPEAIKGKSVMSIFEDGSGTLWFGSSDGSLNKLIATTGEYKFTSFLSEKRGDLYNGIEYIVEDKNYPGLLWLADYYRGTKWFDTKSGKFIFKYPYANLSEKILINNIISVLLDKSGEYWFGTYAAGIYTFKPGDGNNNQDIYEHYNLDPSDPMGINAPNITDLFEDKSGLIWIGTNTSGLYTYNKESKIFRSFSHNPFDSNSLNNDFTLSLMEDKEGKIWIGTELGLDKYDPVTKKYKHYFSEGSYKTSSNIIYALLQDAKGDIWVGTSTGLDKYNPVNDSFIHYSHNPSDSASLSAGEVIKLLSDSKGNLWIGTWNGGLNRMIVSPGDNSVKFLHYRKNENDPASISDNRIMSMAEDNKGNLWIGTSDGGLNKLISDYSFNKDGSIVKPRFINYQHNPRDANSISGNDVRTILIDRNGTIWLGTFGGGMSKFVPPSKNSSGKFVHFSKKDGLANDVVRGILEDDAGYLWIGTSNGLSRFNPADNTFWTFDLADGLQTVKFEDVSFKSKRNGNLYFGGVGGVILFNPAEVKINSYQPDIVITSFRRYDENTGEMIEEKGASERKTLVLPYADNIINLSFSALNYYNPQKNKYAYMLEGYNDNWIYLGNKREITFTNLDPGEYKLLVKSSNVNGVWNKKLLSLAIIITPPWWRTNWAYAAYGFLVLAGIFVTDRLMRRKIIRKEQDKARQREAELTKRQAEELETVDRLVKIINNAEDLDSLFNSLLRQTMIFLPQAEMAAVFLLDKKDNLFKIAFTAGYNLDELGKISFTADELKKRYTQNSEEAESGIYVINKPENLFGDDKLYHLKKPESMLVMAVEKESVTEAYVVFDSFSQNKLFDHSSASFLNRFREHAVSAITKARAIKTLQEKNEEIVRTQEQLVTQQKLASLGALTAGIAHEIKNPLNFVNNFSEISKELLEEMKSNLQRGNNEDVLENFEDLKQNLDKINHHGKRADSIVKGMLLHSRGSSGDKALIDINDLVDQDINLAYHGLRAQDKDFNIKIEKDYDRSIEKINVVPQDISRVIINMVNNACYATNKKKIKSDLNYSPLLKVSTKNANDKVEICIYDNGCGIPAAARKGIFNPFFTTKPAGEGTGLGLSISYDIIVKQHKGEIKFESEEGKFTEFIIRLPKT
jgi:ligand-binding sensor domain-containing protein/signal transduction histidine kinase